MEATMQAPEVQPTLIERIPEWLFHVVVIVVAVGIAFVATNNASAAALVEAQDEAARESAIETSVAEIIVAVESEAAEDAEDDMSDAAEDAVDELAATASIATIAEAAVNAASAALIEAMEDADLEAAVQDSLEAVTATTIEAAETASAEAESEFELEDVYAVWAQLLFIAVAIEMMFFGLRRGWAFASSVQVALIVLLVVSFALMTQEVERDVYEVGIIGLVIITLIQIPFGNIPPTANFRNSMLGLVVGLAILTVVVVLSIALVPTLIGLGR